MSDYTIINLEDVPDSAPGHGLTFGEVRFPRELAGSLGVDDVPAVRVGETVLVGEHELERAGTLLAAARR